MPDRYCVIEKATGLIVNSVMLDAPEAETDEFRYVLCDGSAGIGWTVTPTGVAPPAAPADSEPTVADLLVELESLRARVAALDGNS